MEANLGMTGGAMTGGPITFTPATIGEPVLRWRSRARSIEGIEQELSRIWTSPDLNRDLDGDKRSASAARRLSSASPDGIHLGRRS